MNHRDTENTEKTNTEKRRRKNEEGRRNHDLQGEEGSLSGLPLPSPFFLLHSSLFVFSVSSVSLWFISSGHS
jgi:hypothetical protein